MLLLNQLRLSAELIEVASEFSQKRTSSIRFEGVLAVDCVTNPLHSILRYAFSTEDVGDYIDNSHKLYESGHWTWMPISCLSMARARSSVVPI